MNVTASSIGQVLHLPLKIFSKFHTERPSNLNKKGRVGMKRSTVPWSRALWGCIVFSVL